jgi:hypothetical protein
MNGRVIGKKYIHPRTIADQTDSVTTQDLIAGAVIEDNSPRHETRDLLEGYSPERSIPDREVLLVLERCFVLEGRDLPARVVAVLDELAVDRGPIDVNVEDRHENADLFWESAPDHVRGRGTDLDDLAVGGGARSVRVEGTVSFRVAKEEECEDTQRDQQNADRGPAGDPDDDAGAQWNHSEGPPLRGYHQSDSIRTGARMQSYEVAPSGP